MSKRTTIFTSRLVSVDADEKPKSGLCQNRKCVLLGVASAALVAVVVGVVVYLFARCSKGDSSTCTATLPPPRPTPTPNPTPPPPLTQLRLSRDWHPTHYRLTLHPDIYLSDPDLFHSSGLVNISLESVVSSDVITLHARPPLTVNSSTVRVEYDNRNGLRSIGITSITFDRERHFIHIRLREKVRARTRVSVHVAFGGKISENKYGMFYGTYKEGSNRRYMLATQLEALHARRVFPCLDEPQLKAVFTVSLGHLPTWTALSNSPASYTTNSTVRPGWLVTHFLPTPPMSTYLLAVSVNQYGNLTTPVARYNQSDIQLRQWTRPSYISNGWMNESIYITAAAIQFMQKKFTFNYQLPKLDQITVPGFFGAMENWGLVTYKEAGLLWVPGRLDSPAYEFMVAVIAHEITHQWLGNVVTCKWWSHLWLQEGMATYYQYPIMQHLFPLWDQDQLFVFYWMERALAVDSGDDEEGVTHALYTPPERVQSPAQISSMFGHISYNKGAGFIRMVNHLVLGDQSFDLAMQTYIRKMAYRSADYNDLLGAWVQQAAISNVSLPADMDLQGALRSWVVQSGYPLVTVSLVGGDTYRLTQTPFHVSGPNSTQDKQEWDVPVSYVWQAQPTLTSVTWLRASQTHVDISRPTQLSNWVLLNHKQRGFYRVNYCPQLWDLLITQLNLDPTAIDLVNRGQLILDSTMLARYGYLPYATALNVSHHLQDHPGEFLELHHVYQGLLRLQDVLINDHNYDEFELYARNLLTKSFEARPQSLASNRDDIITSYRHTEAARAACHFGQRACVRWALLLAHRWMQHSHNFTIIPPDLRTIVFCAAIKYDTTGATWRALSRYSRDEIYQQRALGCSRNPTILRHYLLEGNSTGSEMKMSSVAQPGNTVGRLVAWQYITDHWDSMPSGRFALLKLIIKSFYTQTDLDKFEEFRVRYPATDYKERDQFDWCARTIRDNIRWRRYSGDIYEWIRQHR